MPDIIKKTALITGITGQDGAHLSKLLMDKGYSVHGLQRRSSLPNTERIELALDKGLKLHYGDMTDNGSLLRVISDVEPDEIYNLAAQSHVHVSFDTPEYTANADGLGTLRMLEAIRILGMEKKTKFFQASTSELFGKAIETPQTEKTPFYPRSPYAAAKLYAYWMTVNYREAYGLFAVNGIMFNHDGPLRGEEFVTRKVTKAATRIAAGLQDKLAIGNLDAQRDWGHARDYMEGVWKMLQHSTAEDFVLATGQSHTVRELVTLAFGFAGMPLEWSGSGLDEVGRNARTGEVLVTVDASQLRPTEVDALLGDASKARALLGWSPKISFEEMISEMIKADRQDMIRAATA